MFEVDERAIAEALLMASTASSDFDWNQREQLAAEVLASAHVEPSRVYFGGDGLRPYVSVQGESTVALASGVNDHRGYPPLLAECATGVYGPVRTGRVTAHGRPVELWVVSASDQLCDRLAVPVAAVISLTNVARYRAVRYPLNIARLVQWLRFTHSARGYAFDSALDCDGDISALTAAVSELQPDILGISVNFGELDRLSRFVSGSRSLDPRPQLLIGNVLAAWAGETIREVCKGFNTSLAPSYGEPVLESACRAAGGGRAPPASDDGPLLATDPPSEIVLPDERLVVKTLLADGQLAIESSFGCQYGQCTFCPRDHRGDGWSQGDETQVRAVVRRFGELATRVRPQQERVLSFVDEEAFGAPGREPTLDAPPIVELVVEAANAGLLSEVYTRVEQIFDRRKPREWNVRRLSHLQRIRRQLVRVFVGVESGSGSQLRRYGKGQTIERVVDALRAGSLLGVPFEFGFITFDPLLTSGELVENLQFLVREDVVLRSEPRLTSNEIVAFTIDGSIPSGMRGVPVYSRVAYMATELELLSTSRYAHRLKRKYPDLVGEYEPSFARYAYRFADPRIGAIASRCRVWTEGTFESIYRIRLAIRSRNKDLSSERTVIERYRAATFALLVNLAKEFLKEESAPIEVLRTAVRGRLPVDRTDCQFDIDRLDALWHWIREPMTQAGLTAVFDLGKLERRRSA